MLFAALSRAVPVRWIYRALPVLLLIALEVLPLAEGAYTGIVAFGLAGLACSALFPLSISFAGNEFPYLAAVMSGGLIAFYQVGYGVAAFGAGPLIEFASLSLSEIFSWAGVIAAALALGTWILSSRHPASA